MESFTRMTSPIGPNMAGSNANVMVPNTANAFTLPDPLNSFRKYKSNAHRSQAWVASLDTRRVLICSAFMAHIPRALAVS